MGRRQGGPSRTGSRGRISQSIRNRRATQPPAHFQRNPPGRGRLAVFPRCSLDPYESRYGRFARALKNSQLTCGDVTIICETVHLGKQGRIANRGNAAESEVQRRWSRLWLAFCKIRLVGVRGVADVLSTELIDTLCPYAYVHTVPNDHESDCGSAVMVFVGFNIGALTVKVAALHGDARTAKVVSHQGRPVEVLKELLLQFGDGDYFGVSGRLGHISEVAAIQRALREMPGNFDAIASLGGESFLVYLVTGGRITNVLSHNKCAAGSGEFFVQQIGRMGLAMEEAIEESFGGKVVPLASRCSVHCKSDITHKLNRNEASPEEILHTLHDSMAGKVVALLERSQRALDRVLVIGGVSHNEAMLAALRDKLPDTSFVVLPESPWFEAWGSALLVRDEPRDRSPRISVQPSLGTLPSLSSSAGHVHVIAEPPRQSPPEGPLVLGVDAGSTTTKTILLDPSTRAVVAAHYTRTRGDPASATRQCLRALAGDVGNHRVCLVGATGSARELIGAYLGTCHVYNEISSHAAGAAHFDADVDTIFEIGGQDAKYISLRHGVPVDYAMNNACSAGTASLLQPSAHADLP